MSGTPAAASYGDLLVTSLVVLGGVCIAAFVVVRLVGRFLATGRVRGAHLLDVVARVPLEPRRSLYVVEVAGKTLLVGTSEMGLSVLSELDGGEVRARVVARPTFGELVRSAWARRTRARAEPTGGDAGGGEDRAAAGVVLDRGGPGGAAADREARGSAAIGAETDREARHGAAIRSAVRAEATGAERADGAGAARGEDA